MDVSALQARRLRRNRTLKQIGLETQIDYIKIRQLVKGKNTLTKQDKLRLWKLYTKDRIVILVGQVADMVLALYLFLAGLLLVVYGLVRRYTIKFINKFRRQQMRLL